MLQLLGFAYWCIWHFHGDECIHEAHNEQG